MSCCCFELDLNLKIYSNHYKGRKTALWIFCIKKRIDKMLIGEMGVAELRFCEKNLPLLQLISIRDLGITPPIYGIEENTILLNYSTPPYNQAGESNFSDSHFLIQILKLMVHQQH